MNQHRDKYSIITQDGDGGDSAFSTGMMAMTGSKIDIKNMWLFIEDDGSIVRHPFQEKWDDPKLTSRDQVVAFFAGARNSDDETVKSSALSYAKKWKVNKDILLPHVKGYLYLCAGKSIPLMLLPFAYLTLILSILWDAFIKPNHEMNQSVAISSMYGRIWLSLLNNLHPNLKDNITCYFSGWRNKKQMGIEINLFIEGELNDN